MRTQPLSPSLKRSLEEATRRYEVNVDLAMPYLGARGITRETALRFRLGVVGDASSGEGIPGHEQFRERLAIPGLGRASTAYSLRFRALGGEDEPKYLGLPGVPTRLYNIRVIHEAREDFILACEGELDAITASQCGLPAVGVTGASNWKVHHPRMLAGFRTVYVCGDGDTAGKEFTRKVVDSFDQFRPDAVAVTMPKGMDVNELFLQGGEKAIRDVIGIP